MQNEAFYVTTPIYYVNSTPHIGHAYTTIAADILARHQRQRGKDTFFLTGVDEHASKVERVAAEQGLAPQDYADRIVAVWRALPARLGASNDFFIRTSDDGHKRFVQDFLQRLYDNGHVYPGVYSGLYCVGCEAFKTEADLVDGKCPDHDREPEWIEERNWFFRLSAFQKPLLELYDSREDFVLPGFRANEARSFIAGGLQDFSLSRQGHTWGIPIPWDPEQVAYVWADALVNYLSALTYARPGEDLRQSYWPSVRHLLAKDILRFHCVYWPAMLLGAGYAVPRQLFVHGWLLLDDRKISKSLGNIVDPLDLVEVYGPDAVRFWCARSVSFGQDGSASVDGLRERYERELGNDLGNLLSRTTAMVARYRDGLLAPVPSVESPVAVVLESLGSDVAEALDAFDITGALERIWEVIRVLNRHVEMTAPWQLAKDTERASELDGVLYDLVDGLRAVAVALASYLPATAAAILEALRQPASLNWERVAYGLTERVEGIEPAPPLFPRLDPAPAEA
ncbi:MAG: methionine--tRNA ligase [Actinobacteria bacterium]|nr:methionine--tRNA ligase [Actinomycetota bacterium]